MLRSRRAAVWSGRKKYFRFTPYVSSASFILGLHCILLILGEHYFIVAHILDCLLFSDVPMNMCTSMDDV